MKKGGYRLAENSVQKILTGLKNRLDENGKSTVQSFQGYCYEAEFIFNEPTTEEYINKFASETGWVLPADYKAFLLLHNGANFFSYDYGTSFWVYSLEEIVNNYDKELHGENCFPIGGCVDRGEILIDHSRLLENRTDYLLLNGIEIIDFQCNFQTWLDRMIVAQGECYWEWYSKILNPLI